MDITFFLARTCHAPQVWNASWSCSTVHGYPWCFVPRAEATRTYAHTQKALFSLFPFFFLLFFFIFSLVTEE
ncbi:uncharacterized protein BDW43DRAFT_271796 [Aspergillus alliaceus]|uniref:uncharacterized protein n=1 Tax=Petromyces alliaceus TaxID=209559 RepID=UPI0012A5062E|nr:uncharacterized protein BDW43DRAFT_271796 [Aspergillus alliaceus]KAB8234903.1 hypothetical protein BDW43DRAFT_271796 [Aspergillus alliaceus]